MTPLVPAPEGVSTPGAPAGALLIDGLVEPGVGLAHDAGKAVLVNGALTGEWVTVRARRVHAGYEVATTDTVLEPSPARVMARCGVYGLCGGCAVQHQQPAAQLLDKQRSLLEKLERVGKLKPQAVAAPLEGPAWHYRARARLAVQYGPGRAGTHLGFRPLEGEQPIVADDCPVLEARLAALIPPLRRLLPALSATPHIPHLELLAADEELTVLIRLLEPLPASDLRVLQRFAARWQVRLFLQLADGEARPVTPDDGHALHYTLPDFGLEYRFGPLDFTQVNPALNRQLVVRAVDWLAPQAGQKVVDLYCGVGNFALAIARQGARVLGLERSAGAVSRARDNAAHNGLAALTSFRVADLEACPPAVAEALEGCASAVLDPPRSGARALSRVLAASAVPRVVYVSCDPATLARDAAILVHEGGFVLRQVGVADMFPQTAHVESVALFERD